MRLLDGPRPATARPPANSIGRATTTAANRPYFPLADSFRSPLPAKPALDPASGTIAAALGRPGASRILTSTSTANPSGRRPATTPRYRVQIKMAGAWGDNDLRHTTVPIPTQAKPSPGTDGRLVVVDRAAGKVYDLWQAARTPTGCPPHGAACATCPETALGTT